MVCFVADVTEEEKMNCSDVSFTNGQLNHGWKRFLLMLQQALLLNFFYFYFFILVELRLNL